MSRLKLFRIILSNLFIVNLAAASQIDRSYVENLLAQKVDTTKILDDSMMEQILSRMEKNLEFYEKNFWSLDMRASYQLFMTNLNLKMAMNDSQMIYYEKNKEAPLKMKRVRAIVTRATNLTDFLRDRVLSRVPRLNLTRQVAALFVFTELPWFRFTPIMLSTEDQVPWTAYLKRTLARKYNLNQMEDFPSESEYAKDLVLKSDDAQRAHNLTLECLEGLTKDPINETVLNITARNETIRPRKCKLPRELRERCFSFASQGKPFKHRDMYGHVNFYRIVMLTAGRLARNCYFMSRKLDLQIIHFLCFVALIQVDKLKSIDPSYHQSSYYKDSDSLTKHDFAHLCLMNGLTQFMMKDLAVCENNHLIWKNDVGCYGPAGATARQLNTPNPWWIIMRPNIHENNFCNRRQTASCFAYLATVVRAVVQLGGMKPPPTVPASQETQSTTTEYLPERR